MVETKKVDDEILNSVDAQMRVGAKIQKFYDILQEYRVDLKSWTPENEFEECAKRAKEEMLFSIMDEYFDIFDSIIAGGS